MFKKEVFRDMKETIHYIRSHEWLSGVINRNDKKASYLYRVSIRGMWTVYLKNTFQFLVTEYSFYDDIVEMFYVNFINSSQ